MSLIEEKIDGSINHPNTPANNHPVHSTGNESSQQIDTNGENRKQILEFVKFTDFYCKILINFIISGKLKSNPSSIMLASIVLEKDFLSMKKNNNKIFVNFYCSFDEN